MYDKLGELLNEALNSGQIPQFETNNINNPENTDLLNSQETNNFVKKSAKASENYNTKQNLASNPEKTDEKLYKYADFMQFPYNTRQILSTLHIAYPFSWNLLKQKLLQDIKFSHPDTKNTIQNSKGVQNFKHLDVNTLISYYRELDGFFKKKEQDG